MVRDIYTFTYHGQNGQEKIYILLLTMDKTGKRRYNYLYLAGTKREREDIYILLLTMDKKVVHGM
jgi:uncharacterized protein YrzB (UPF0473 family)